MICVTRLHLFCACHRRYNVGFEHATFLIVSSRPSRKNSILTSSNRALILTSFWRYQNWHQQRARRLSDFNKVEKSNKTGFFSSLDMCEHVSPVQVILITMHGLNIKLQSGSLSNLTTLFSKTFSNTSTFDTRHSNYHFAHNLFARFSHCWGF